MAIDVLAQLEQEFERANAPRTTGKFASTFLVIKANQKALIRPLTNLNGMTVLKMHHMYNPTNAKLSINAVCPAGPHIGPPVPCQHCADAANEKKLKAGNSFFLPVWVYKMAYAKADPAQHIAAGDPVTYTDENGLAVPVSGPRILELTVYGAISTVLGILQTYYNEEDAHDIRVCDFVIERVGSGQSTSYNVIPKAPKPFTISVPLLAPVEGRVQEACPPVVIGGVRPSVSAASAPIAQPDAPEF